MKSQNLIGIIMKSGWRMARQNGSHIHFKHTSRRGLVTVPHSVFDLPKGTIKSILRQAGMTIPISLLVGISGNGI
jgi:predicted RNA binding protein YcfA (HicA-like mRNA interferase family)